MTVNVIAAAPVIADSRPEAELVALALGHTIRRLRGQRGLTQRTLAERAGLTHQHVSGVERGRVNPTLRTITALARALGMSLPTLFGEVEKIQGATQLVLEHRGLA